jgi:undecaprenyl-diphosphatase
VHGLKLLFARPRPQAESLLVTMPPDFSFPSAHTAQVTAFACACALIFAERRPSRKTTLLRTGLAIPVFLVGISRIYLQVHYISDVLAGALIGALWTFSLYRLVNAAHDEA